MTHNDIWMAIEQFAAERKMSCSCLAKSGGMDPTTFNRSKRWSRFGQPRWPNTNSIAKILAATDSDIEDFVKFIKKDEELDES